MELRRQIYDAVHRHIGAQKVVLIYGTRRTGKTTLARVIQKELGERSIWFNGEDLDVQALFAQRTVANFKSMIGNNEVVIIDEAQAIPEVGAALKLMIDELPSITIIATGSSSFDLSNQTGEPLVGRSHIYRLYPLSQQELAPYETALETRGLLPQRLIYGSYPEVVGLEQLNEKQDYLKSLISSYLLKDILTYAEVKGANVLYKLLQLLAWQVGGLVSTTELGNTLKVKGETVERYLDLLHKVFVIFPLGGFSKNLRKEVAKSKKWYFFDNGIRNAVINDFRPLETRNDLGQLWEQYIISERIKLLEGLQQSPNRYYWRTYDQQEIDLLEVDAHQRIHAFECKWSSGKTRIPLGFARNYADAEFTVVSRDNYLDIITHNH
jgi:predicted AAA+ superfamily ATPase